MNIGELKDIILVLGFLGAIIVAIFGKPKSTADLDNKICGVMEKLNELINQLTTTNANLQALQKENQAIWKKIDFLVELGLKHDRQIAYLKGKAKIEEEEEEVD